MSSSYANDATMQFTKLGAKNVLSNILLGVLKVSLQTRKQFEIQLTGTSALLMNNNLLVDTLHPLKKQIAKITAKGKKKTDADIEMLYRLEWEGALYFDKVLGPFIPQRCLNAMLKAGARKSRDGKQFEEGLIVNGDARLEYDGPRDMEGLWDGGFRWTTVCGNQRASIMRTRPRFEDWSVDFSVTVEADLVDQDMLDRALYHAQLIGLCDGRAIGMGRFNYTIQQITAESNGRVAAATK